MSQKIRFLVVAIVCSVFSAIIFYFLENTTTQLLVREGLLFLSVIIIFMTWKKCGVDDEDKIFWLGIWISLLVIFIISFIHSMVQIVTNSVAISDYSMLIYAIAFGVCTMIFGSNLDTKIPKKISIILKIIIAISIVGYLIYLNTLAPTQAEAVYVDGQKIGGTYIITGFIMLIVVSFTLFNSMILQLKIFNSYMKTRIDLWMATSAVYLTIIQLCFVMAKPIIISPNHKWLFAQNLGNYILIGLCVFLIITGLYRFKLGAIEETKYDIYSGKKENRMPETK